MKAIPLTAEKRTVLGKKVRKLRAQGMVPVGVYGKDVKSVALSIPVKEFVKVYAKAGETGLIDLQFGEQTLPVLVKSVQVHPLSRQILHAEMHAVKLTEKIKANVPIEIIGEAPAVQNNIGVLLQILNDVEVEALPTELPESIQVDVSSLSEVGQQVSVGELKLPKGVELLTSGEELVVKVAPAVSEETAKELAAEESAKAAETAPGEAAAEAPPATAGGSEDNKGSETTVKAKE